MSERISHNRAKHEIARAQDGVEQLLEANILDNDKTLILLTYTGAKPFSQIITPLNIDSQDRIESIRRLLLTLGVSFDESPYSHVGQPWLEFRIARDNETLERVRAHKEIPHSKDNADWHRTYGQLLGFPRTAVEAYVRHQPLLESLPDEIRRTDVGKFFERWGSLRLSRAHWQEELKTVEKWMHAVHSASPEYFEHLMSDAAEPPSAVH